MSLDQRSCVDLGPGRHPGGRVRPLRWLRRSSLCRLGGVRRVETDERPQRLGQKALLDPRAPGRDRALEHHSAVGRGGDDVDVLAGRPAAAGPAQVVAGNARAIVVNRPQAVSTVAARIARQPFPLEELAPLGQHLLVGLPPVSAGRDHRADPRADPEAEEDDPGQAGPQRRLTTVSGHNPHECSQSFCPWRVPFDMMRCVETSGPTSAYYICRSRGGNPSFPRSEIPGRNERANARERVSSRDLPDGADGFGQDGRSVSPWRGGWAPRCSRSTRRPCTAA